MASSIDDITIEYIENGSVIVKEIDKVVLSKGAWTTIMFKYQEFDRKKDEFGKIKFSIRRYQKRNGEYFQKSKFNISSIEQAKKISDTIEKWI